MTGRRGRKRKKLLDGLKEKEGHWKLKKKASDRTMWRCYGLVIKQTTWMNK